MIEFQLESRDSLAEMLRASRRNICICVVEDVNFSVEVDATLTTFTTRVFQRLEQHIEVKCCR